MKIGNYYISNEFKLKWTIQIKYQNNFSCSVDGLQYEAVWEVPGQIEFKALAHLQTSISVKHSQPELDRALLYFEKYVYDFPGEFFLQKPFIFTVSISNDGQHSRRISNIDFMSGLFFSSINLIFFLEFTATDRIGDKQF